jgi:hypothetical protein
LGTLEQRDGRFMSMKQCKLNLTTLSNYVVVASRSCSFRIDLELETRYRPPGPPGPPRLRVKTASRSRPRPAARPRPVGASAREAQSPTPNRRRRSGVNDWEEVPPTPCSTRRTGGSSMPKPLSSRLHIGRHHASARLQHRPFQPGLRGPRFAGIEGSMNWRFPIHAWKCPIPNEEFSIHAWTIPILNGDFPCMRGQLPF